MDKLAKLCHDVALLWSKYWPMYLNGVRNTLILALVATVIGFAIGLICGILNTIPYTKQDPLPKRFVLKLIRVLVRIYVEVFRGTPMVLQAVFIYYGLPYITDAALRFDSVWAAAILGGEGINRVSVIPPWLLIFAIVFSVLIGLGSGYYPANKAVQIPALEAIKSE